MMKRRQFVKNSVAFSAVALLSRDALLGQEETPSSALSFSGAAEAQQKTYNAALGVLAANVKQVPGYNKPVLLEGAVYAGVWLECGPQEAHVYRHMSPDIARQNHLAFFALQRADGQLPASIKVTETGFGQIQMVVPIAATAWETAQETGDSELLEKAYAACSRWDDWLMTYRNTRGTGLVEGFCTYDTGHDNSPRWKGVPNRCPDADAKKLPKIPGLPRLCPDLSATVYGGRVALAAMASALGKGAEQTRWEEKAESIRRLIIERLYSAEDACFYDLDSENNFVRVRGDLLTRVLGEHVVDQSMFNAIWKKQIDNPRAFWAPFPLPSIALDDPAFVRPIPRNSWGGASQALTALRAPRWFEHYGKPAELGFMMQRWTEAIRRDGDFHQQMDPLTGEFTRLDPGGYSPAALVFLDFTWRLGGVRVKRGDLEWNCRPDLFSPGTRFARKLPDGREAEMLYAEGSVELKLAGKPIHHLRGKARVLSGRDGSLTGLVGVAATSQAVTLLTPAGKTRRVKLQPNEHVRLQTS